MAGSGFAPVVDLLIRVVNKGETGMKAVRLIIIDEHSLTFDAKQKLEDAGFLIIEKAAGKDVAVHEFWPTDCEGGDAP